MSVLAICNNDFLNLIDLFWYFGTKIVYTKVQSVFNYLKKFKTFL